MKLSCIGANFDSLKNYSSHEVEVIFFTHHYVHNLTLSPGGLHFFNIVRHEVGLSATSTDPLPP